MTMRFSEKWQQELVDGKKVSAMVCRVAKVVDL